MLPKGEKKLNSKKLKFKLLTKIWQENYRGFLYRGHMVMIIIIIMIVKIIVIRVHLVPVDHDHNGNDSDHCHFLNHGITLFSRSGH